MNSVDTFLLRKCNDSRDVQIGLDGTLAGANLVGFVSLEAMQGEPVFLRIDGYGAKAEFIGGTEDTNGDFAAVGGGEVADRFGVLHFNGDQGVAGNYTLFHGDGAAYLQFFRLSTQIVFVRRNGRITVS